MPVIRHYFRVNESCTCVQLFLTLFSTLTVMKNELISQPAKMLGLDRAGMEAERLKRLKRKQEFSDEEARPCSTPKLARDEVPVHRNARIGQQDIESNDSTLNTPEASKPSSLSSKSESSIPYPYGIVKKTYAFGYDDINAVKIESILQKEELQIALLSSWQVDFAWLSTKLNLKRTRLILVMQSKSESEVCVLFHTFRQYFRSISAMLRDKTNRRHSGGAKPRNGRRKSDSVFHPCQRCSIPACIASSCSYSTRLIFES